MWHQAVKGKCVRGFRVSCLPTQIITRIRCETGGLTWGFGSPKGSGADLAVQHVRLAVFDPFPKFALRYDAHMTQWAYERAPAKHVPACLRACASRSQACTVPSACEARLCTRSLLQAAPLHANPCQWSPKIAFPRAPAARLAPLPHPRLQSSCWGPGACWHPAAWPINCLGTLLL